jgi:site-specific recombinase XerD
MAWTLWFAVTVKKAGVKTFGLMDVRAKGATDMYLAGVPLEHIQMLMGHRSVQTTEIYIKRLLATVSTVAPNSVKIGS